MKYLLLNGVILFSFFSNAFCNDLQDRLFKNTEGVTQLLTHTNEEVEDLEIPAAMGESGMNDDEPLENGRYLDFEKVRQHPFVGELLLSSSEEDQKIDDENTPPVPLKDCSQKNIFPHDCSLGNDPQKDLVSVSNILPPNSDQNKDDLTQKSRILLGNITSIIQAK